MAIAQDAYFIPDDIDTGLVTGVYRRFGSVIRYAVGPKKGQIVKHLKPIDSNAAEQAQGLGVKTFQFLKQHKKGTAIVLASVATAGVGSWIYSKVKSSEPKVVAEFRFALKVYIEAIRIGSMDLDKINALMRALEKIKEYKNFDKINIQLSSKELDVLVNRIYDYTVKLAKDNSIQLKVNEEEKSGNTITNLQRYLQTQKRIFEAA